MLSDDALISAGIEVGRLDERLASPAAYRLVRGWFVRREAMRIAAREKLATDELRYAAYAANLSPDIPDQALRSTVDIGDALGIVLSWDDRNPKETDIREVWEASNRSNIIRVTPERQWQLDNAFGETAKRIDLMMTDVSFEKTAKAFLDTWTDPVFKREAPRMALILAPFLVRKGLKAPQVLVGLARAAMLPLETEDEPTVDDKLNDFAAAIRKGAEDSYQASLKLGRLEKELTRLAAPARSSSSVEPAVRELLRTPVVNPPTMAEAINISLRGAGMVLEQLETTGVLSKLNPQASRSRVYVCHKALNV